MNLSSAPPFLSFNPHPRYPSQMCSSSTGKLCRYHPFSPHISGRFATNLRYVECENWVLFDYTTLLRFVELKMSTLNSTFFHVFIVLPFCTIRSLFYCIFSLLGSAIVRLPLLPASHAPYFRSYASCFTSSSNSSPAE